MKATHEIIHSGYYFSYFRMSVMDVLAELSPGVIIQQPKA